MGKLSAARHGVVAAKGMIDGPVAAHGNKYGVARARNAPYPRLCRSRSTKN